MSSTDGWLAYASASYTRAKASSVSYGSPLRPFFNPSYLLVGSLGELDEAAGSYYYHGANAESECWHLYDQLIMSPRASTMIRHQEDLRILTILGQHRLLTQNTSGAIVPDKTTFSDHLPLYFKLIYDLN